MCAWNPHDRKKSLFPELTPFPPAEGIITFMRDTETFFVTPVAMKTFKSLLTVIAALVTFSSAAFALPGWKGGPTDPPSPAMTKHDFDTLKSGDKIALVCKASNSVQVIDIKDQKAALELCKSGKMLHCPLCKMDYKVTLGNPTGKGAGNQTTVVAVNEKGEPCMFFAKLAK